MSHHIRIRLATATIAVLLAVTSAILPTTVQATIEPRPVQARVVGEAPVLHPGEPATIAFELVSPLPVAVTGLSVTSSSLMAPLAAPAGPLTLSPNVPLPLSVQVQPSSKPDPLVIRWEVDGVPFEQAVDLAGRLESRLAERQGLEQVATLATPKPDPRLLAEADSVQRAKSAAGTKSTLIFFTGQLVYTRPGRGSVPPVDLGAWGVRVSLMDEDTGFDDELGYTYTQPDGTFYAYAPWDGQLGEGDPELYLHFETDHPWVVVQEGFWDIEYSWDTPVRPSGTADLRIGTMRPSDSSTHPALHIANDIARDHEWYVTYPRNWFLGAVDVKWPEGSTGAYYDPVFGQIHIGTDREWREDTHAHEYGHYFVDTFGGWVSPDYCNGYCDTGDCGHCMWCPEGADEAMTEGWPDWIAHVQTSSYAATYGLASAYVRDSESIKPCEVTGTWLSAEDTEGYLAAVLQDIWDSGPGTDDADPNGRAGYHDWLELGDDEILQVLDLDAPTTARGFLTAFANRYPQHRQRLWYTAMNSNFDLDQLPPGAPGSLASSSHAVGASTAKLNVSLSWTQPGPDDWSGVAGYSIAFAASPTVPDAVIEAGPVSSYVSGDLAAGTYYATVRTIDYAGRGSTSYATYGPFSVVTPTPVDIAPYLAPGWARPMVARATGDATATSVPNPVAQLTGNSAPTYFNMSGRNQGQSDHTGFIGVRTRLFVDGIGTYTSGYVHPDAAGATFTHLNRAVTIRGGRHMVGAMYDGFNEWWESNEVNNYWSHAWVWSPLALTANAPVRRTQGPPIPTGSWSGSVDGAVLYWNCDGLRFTGSGSWNAVWVAADADTADYGARLHAPSASPNTGFDAVLGYVNHPAGCLDGVVVNRNTMGTAAWDVGVINDFDSSNDPRPQSSYVAKHVTSTALAYGTTTAVAFPDSEYVVLKEVVVPQAGPVTITVRDNDSGSLTYVAWLSRQYTTGGLDAADWTWPAGETTLLRQADAPGSYCVALYRDPKNGRQARSVTLRVGPPLADLAAGTPGGWAGPVVPRSQADGSSGAVPAPTALTGGAGAWVNLAIHNNSPGAMAAAQFLRAVELDGSVRNSQAMPGLAAGVTSLQNNVPLGDVPGGRHVLAARYDTGNAESEASEANNHWGEQWVWSPSMLAIDGGAWWPSPPDAVGGFAQVTGAQALFYNSAGFRVEYPAGVGAWGGVGVSPADSSDVDLRLHEPVDNVRDGFGPTLRSSAWGQASSDYVIAKHDAARTFDISVVRSYGGGAGSYAIAAVAAPSTASLPLAPADRVMGAASVLQLQPIVLPAGDIRLRLVNVAGIVDWGLSVHDDHAAIQGKADALMAAWEAGPGAGEEFLLHVDTPDTFVVAVWKRGGAGSAESGTWRLTTDTVASATSGPVPALVSALHAPWPAPFSGRTRVSFELAAAGEATLEVYDVRGARVRKLVAGSLAAGRHEAEWLGEDDRGRRLPPGVYLLRLQSGGGSWTRKLVKVR